MKLEIAKKLIQTGCVKFSPSLPYIYASGLKGPIYCDNRLILSHVDFRDIVIEAFLTIIDQCHLQFDYIGGIATAGIPHASFIADRLKSPMVYVRPKAKEHGRKNQVEGDFLPNQTVLLVEDLINQGSSLAEAMKGLREAQLLSTHCLCIVDYQMAEARKKAEELSLELVGLTDFAHLIEAAYELKFIDLNDKETLLNWHADPKGWSVNSLKV